MTCLENKTDKLLCSVLLSTLLITGNLLHFIEFHAADNAAFLAPLLQFVQDIFKCRSIYICMYISYSCLLFLKIIYVS